MKGNSLRLLFQGIQINYTSCCFPQQMGHRCTLKCTLGTTNSQIWEPLSFIAICKHYMQKKIINNSKQQWGKGKQVRKKM